MRKVIDNLEEIYISTLLGVMTGVTFGEVVARYVFNSTISIAHESVVLCFAWLIFIGMSFGVRTGSHIGIDFLVKKFSTKGQRYIAMVVAILCVVYALIIVYGGFIYVSKMYKVGIYLQDLPIKQWIPRLVIPLGFGLLAFRFIEVFYKLAKGKKVHLLGDEVKDALKLKID